MKRILIGLLLASSANALSLSNNVTDMITKSLQHNPDILEAAAKHRAIEFQVLQAKAGYKPTVDLLLGVGREYTDSPSTRGNNHNTNTLTRSQAEITINQMLYNGDETNSEVKRQTARAEAAKSRLYGLGDQTALKMIEAYNTVITKRAILSLANFNVTAHETAKDQITLKSNAGVSSKADADQISARVALVTSNYIAAQNNLTDADTAFSRQTGFRPPLFLQPLEAVSNTLMPKSLEQAINEAKANNHTLQQANHDVASAFAQEKAAHANNKPDVFLEAKASADNNLDGTVGHNNGAQVMLFYRHNLYNGGRDKARIAETQWQIQEAMQIRRRTHRQVEEEVHLAWAALESTTKQIVHIQNQVDFAQSTTKAYSTQFRINKRSLLDVLNSENELFEARISLVEANANRINAQYRLLAISGVLVKYMNIDLAKLDTFITISE